MPGADRLLRVRPRGDSLPCRTYYFSGWQQQDPPCQTRPRCRCVSAGPCAGRTTACRGWKTNSRNRLRRPGMSKVYLVGAGPGDPDLITWKGRKLLAQADSILYDNLVNEHLLDLAPPNCERIYVGKKKSVHAFPQEEICAMLIDRARRGLNVVRLKGGDPFIFGRGGEELEALADAGVQFEVVPGVTSPLGIAAYSG